MTMTPNDMICFALYSASHAMQQVYRKLLDEVSLTYPQYLVFTVLWNEERPPAVFEIGQQLQLDSGTLTPLLKRLQSAGYVERTRDLHDERRVLISLTDKGKAMQQKCAHIPRCVLESTGKNINDINKLRDELDELSKHLRTSLDK